jgi:transcriptional repressor NrdR
MKCPYCGCQQDKVVDSRASREERAVRRRRECLECGKRFTTYEYVEQIPLTVIKRDKRREPFDREKLFNGINTACKKRSVSRQAIEEIVDRITETIEKLSKVEVESREIGKLVMEELAHVDDVAYIRFASVYREFKDKGEFISEIKEMPSKAS